MNSKLEMAIDSTAIANNVMFDIIDLERMEKMLECELSSSDLFKIDCAILSHLREATDFSKDLLNQLETEMFTTKAEKPHNSMDLDFKDIQRDVITDITLPLHEMFDNMSDFVIDALK